MLILCVTTLLALLAAPALADDLPFEPAEDERWVLIDTRSYELTVYRGDQPAAHFKNLAVGRHGTAEFRRRGDRTTPLGRFRIDRIHTASEYQLFLGLDYPSLRLAQRARREGVIDAQEYRFYLDEHARLGRPPQNSALGGHIGIHGVGSGSVHFHRHVNWTDGCIALENDQVEALSRMVEIGTLVIIR